MQQKILILYYISDHLHIDDNQLAVFILLKNERAIERVCDITIKYKVLCLQVNKYNIFKINYWNNRRTFNNG